MHRPLRCLLFIATVAGLGAAACGSKSALRSDGAANDGTTPVPCSAGGSAHKALGQACGCAGDCQSGFCIDGVCCNNACTETCKACNTATATGPCAPVAIGLPPRAPDACPKADASTCGFDGTCNGAGACRRYAPGTVCQPGTCDGASVSGVRVCDAVGRCKPGPAIVCAPFDCNASTNQCFASCQSDGDCADGVKCVNGSCGPKPRGAVCQKNDDCASSFCSDGLCCNVACKGACVSCNQVGREGTCWPVDPGLPDPRHACKVEDAATCGQTGKCDGFGGCALHAAETICTPPSCAQERLNTAGTCNGLGACRAPGVQNCWPYRCSGDACTTKCATDDDCQPGHACVAGSCGPKPNGQSCANTTECGSGFCVDGVCCAEACAGTCKSCALPSSMGRCAPVPAGAVDPRGVCANQGAPACGTDGFCDGAGGCRKYKAGTQCAAEHCEANVYTAASTCNNTGQCATPPSQSCAPYACNGARCFTSCGSNAACVTPNTCDAQSSCGKKGNGAFCSDKSECASTFCAQGICCATACTGACKSCALASALGSCVDVPTGAPDPSGTCVVQNALTCGTNGMCQAGACQKYPSGAPCRAAQCPAATATFTPASACDGAGTCVTPAATSCAPYKCGAAACKATCAADADCVAPSVCSSGSCGLKSAGAACGDGSECATGICAQGVCCRTACAGTCLSCAGATTIGTCAAVTAGGADPSGTCTHASAASCGTTGVCDGQGGCRLYAAGTVCAPPSCPPGGTTETLARTCDGVGTCRPAATLSCTPFACNGTTCNTTCVSDADCAAPDICDVKTNLCGNKKRLGQSCAASAECLTGNYCVDGVCCASSSCATCQSCGIPGQEGTCGAVPAGAADPQGRCVPSPPCGLVGTCNGAGMCQFAPTTTSCGTSSCTGSTYTPTGFCNGAGTCAQTSVSCSPYVCGPSGACLTTCGGEGDCVVGSSCLGTSCSSLRANGTACTIDPQCISGHCVGQVCCGAASCPSCYSCAVAGFAGSCAPVPAGGTDPAGLCLVTAASTCGTNGACNGAGACAFHTAGIVCAPAACKGGANLANPSMCNGKGNCMMGTNVSCVPYTCADGACKTAPCAGNGDCAPGHMCELGTNTCQ